MLANWFWRQTHPNSIIVFNLRDKGDPWKAQITQRKQGRNVGAYLINEWNDSIHFDDANLFRLQRRMRSNTQTCRIRCPEFPQFILRLRFLLRSFLWWRWQDASLFHLNACHLLQCDAVDSYDQRKMTDRVWRPNCSVRKIAGIGGIQYFRHFILRWIAIAQLLERILLVRLRSWLTWLISDLGMDEWSAYLHECDRLEAHFFLDRGFVRNAWWHGHSFAHKRIGLRQSLALSIATQPVQRRTRLDLYLQTRHVNHITILIACNHRQLRRPTESHRLLDHLQFTLIRIEARFRLQPSG